MSTPTKHREIATRIITGIEFCQQMRNCHRTEAARKVAYTMMQRATECHKTACDHCNACGVDADLIVQYMSAIQQTGGAA